jgi:cytochrome bd ubiquinol oxidase subunit I
VPLVLFAIPDEEARENRFEIAIPYGASLILTHTLDGEVPGLNEFVGKHPARRAGLLRLPHHGRHRRADARALLVGAWRLWRRGDARRSGAGCCAASGGMTFSGWIATLAGWYVTEIGRQPWLVTGVLTTAEAVGRPPGSHASARRSLMYLVALRGAAGAYVACCSTGGQGGAGADRGGRARMPRRRRGPTGRA